MATSAQDNVAEEPLKRTETLQVRNDASHYSLNAGGGYYLPEPYQTYHIPHSHPALDGPRRSIGHAFHAFGNAVIHPYGENDIRTPRADISESKGAFYIDVDIPGLEAKSNISLKWLNASTLFLEAVTKRPALPSGESEKDVHLIVRERKIGTFARAFAFPVAVDQDATKARLGYGVVRLTVPKKAKGEGHQVKEVEVEHAGH